MYSICAFLNSQKKYSPSYWHSLTAYYLDFCLMYSSKDISPWLWFNAQYYMIYYIDFYLMYSIVWYKLISIQCSVLYDIQLWLNSYKTLIEKYCTVLNDLLPSFPFLHSICYITMIYVKCIWYITLIEQCSTVFYSI